MKLEPYLKEKLLCKHSGRLFCYYHGELVIRSSTNRSIMSTVPIINRIKGNNLVGRLLRYYPRVATALSENEFIFSFHGSFYHYSSITNEVRVEHNFIKGMSNPLSLCVRKDIKGNIIEVLYGEYSQNYEKKEVCIFSRRNGLWKCVFKFPPGTIKHVHYIFDDIPRERLLILTGDDDIESGIWEADYDFSNVRLIVGGNQKYRACVMYIISKDLFFPSDTPLEQNGLYRFNIESDCVEKKCDLPGPVIFGRVVDDKLYFSTSVETDSRIKGIRYFLSNNLGKGIKDRFSYLFCADCLGEVNEICRMEKDILPLVLFGFGNMSFPTTDDNNLFVCPQCLKAKYGTYICVSDTLE